MDEFMKASANARVLDPVDSVTSIIIFCKELQCVYGRKQLVLELLGFSSCNAGCTLSIDIYCVLVKCYTNVLNLNIIIFIFILFVIVTLTL
jgi:hypothetical protein